MDCQEAQRKIPKQRVTCACAAVMRDAQEEVVAQFSDSEDENHDFHNEKLLLSCLASLIS